MARKKVYFCVSEQIEEKEDDDEKENQNIKKLKFFIKEKIQTNIQLKDIEEIRILLEHDKKLINYRHCKDNKLKSILHIVKYDSKFSYEIKEKLVNAIVDVGYRLYKFSENCTTENVDALFFVAARGDIEKLKEIVEYFKNTDVRKLHDTKEGDSVLSFMLKFGNHTHENYRKCFELLINEKIDCQRIDYYKKNIKEIIENEKKFLVKMRNKSEFYKRFYENLTEIEEIMIKNGNLVYTAEECNAIFLEIRNKSQLFHSVLEANENFEILLSQNMNLKDSDDGENTLLQLAIIKNNFKITKALLQKGVDPNRIVNGRNENVPLILAAKLNRDKIFIEILRNERLKITKIMFKKFASKIKLKFLNYILEYNSKSLDVNFEFNDKTPLYYAIINKNRKVIQSLLHRGAPLTDNCLCNINPKDLEEYFNSCIKMDTFKGDIEEICYKPFLVFDFFIKHNSPTTNSSTLDVDSTVVDVECKDEDTQKLIPVDKYESEIEIIRKIGSSKRLKYLLEHPLIYIFLILKWYRVRYYYFAFVVMKFIFYTIIVFLVSATVINIYILSIVILIQFLLVYLNFLEFKLDIKKYTLHFILEILIYALLSIIWILKIIHLAHLSDDINQLSAFIIIFISMSMLLSLGYHVDLSKWMSMAKRVFRNFCILLFFFLIPILGFAIAFTLLLPFRDEESEEPKENEDFKNLARSIFRTFVMLSGDIGDKNFISLGGYIMFLLFAIGMAIILMNFWTGVAVSDIKEIEEQSTVVACNNVVVFIESVEQTYEFFICNFLQKILPPRWKYLTQSRFLVPFLKSAVELDKKEGKKNKIKIYYGIDLYINEETPFKNNECFKSLKLENDILSKIKSLNDDKELNIEKTLKLLIDQTKVIENIHSRMSVLENNFKKIEHLLKSENR